MQSSIPETPTTGTAMTPKAKLEHDEFFYFHSVVFQAENKLFKVPRYGLPAEDGVFAAMFALPTAGDREAEGSSDENPIVLPAEVSAHDFRSLLKASYPPPGTTHKPALAIDEWMSVIKLSTMWCLDGLRKKAVDEAEKLFGKGGPVEKVLLGKKYTVSKWLIEGYKGLGKRDDMITDEEREQLGIETYVGLVKLREQSWAWSSQGVQGTNEVYSAGYNDGYSRRGNQSYNYEGSTKGRKNFGFDEAIREIFKEELVKDREYVTAGQV